MNNDSQPRLAYLVSQYPAISHTFILREIRHLRGRGFDIRVASVNAPDRETQGLTAAEREEAASTYYLKRSGARGALVALLSALVHAPLATLAGLFYALRLSGASPRRMLYGLFYFVEAVMVGHWMRGQELTHLHVHFATPASTVGLIASRIVGVGFSLTVHGPDEFYDVQGYHLEEKISAAEFVCCIGFYSRSQLMKLSTLEQWSKFEISPLGVDLEAFAQRPHRAAPEIVELICVGRLVEAKGQHILVRAIGRLVAGGRRVHLRFVGDGPDRQSLERQVEDLGLSRAVTFEGAVNQDRIVELYRAADIFALASFAEGIPVVLMEAMAMEIPVVTTFITGIPELIRDGIDGLLTAPSDDAGLATAIASLMDDAAWRRQLGVAGRQRVAERFHLQHNTDRLAAIFRSRLSGVRQSVEFPAEERSDAAA